MKGIFIAILINIICIANIHAHPVHVSVINIYFEGSRMQIEIRSFIDDWETAYYHYKGEPTDLRKGDLFENKWFNEYFDASFSLSKAQKASPFVLEKDTVFYDDLAMTIKLHADLNKKPKSLYIYNAILTDIFADQTNLLIISYENREKGIKFDVKKNEEVMMLK